MEKIVKLVSEKAGITEAQATTAVNTVIGFLKDRMPGGMGAQVESYLKGEGEKGGTAGDIGNKIGGMFKK